ncbi:MAG: DUF2809 domain-containing protein [Xenococcaceae cyanobacterium]
MNAFFRNPRLLTFLSLLIVTPLGFLSKFYTGLGQEWFNYYGGGTLYEIFWCLLFFWLIPKRKAVISIPLWVFGITCALEILQLWKTPILQSVRSSLTGRFLLGTTFSWWDFPHYVVGCLIGWLWLRQIWQLHKPKPNAYND